MTQASGPTLPRFQSTPLPTGRSDIDAKDREHRASCFNPRPSQPEGATCSFSLRRFDMRFQSTPLPTGRSDFLFLPRHEREKRFQSTPLPTGRSDNRIKSTS